jgi:hypothetical protein
VPSSGTFSLLICRPYDGIDNDGDGLIDMGDPGCTSPTDPSEHEATLPCDDGVDNDGDGLIDYPADPGCASPKDLRETFDCSDGIDNDGDGLIDFDGGASANHGVALGPPDPGCANALSDTENPACQDGIDNDGDGGIDFDGGASANHGVALGPPDVDCWGHPTRGYETVLPPLCGLGAELSIAVPLLMWLRRGVDD